MWAVAVSATTSSPAVASPAEDEVAVLVLWRSHAPSSDREVARDVIAEQLPVAVSGWRPVGGDVEVVHLAPDAARTVAARTALARSVSRIVADHPEVHLAEPDREVSDIGVANSSVSSTRAVAPNDPLFGWQWGLSNTGQELGESSTVPVATAGVDVRILDAWAVTRGDPQVEVAVIDTVIDATHPDLQGAVTGSYQAPTVDGALAAPGDHGTAVGSVIAARADDGIGLAGVAPQVSLQDLAAFTDGDGVAPGSATVSGIVGAILEAGDREVAVINASWVTSDPSPILREVIADVGLPLVAATGNDGRTLDATTRVFPAGYDLPNVLSVTAIAADGSVPTFANTGPVVDIAAPGDAVPVALPGGEFGIAQGTSFAAPHASAALALAASVAPYLTASDLVDAARWTSRPEPALTGRTVTGGMLDVGALVRGVQRPVCRSDEVAPLTFADVADDSVHAPAIRCLAELGVAQGRDADHFGPAQDVTRAQFASLLGRIVLDAGWSPSTAPLRFPDVDPASVHAPAIVLLDELGIVRGRGDGTYGPGEPIQRDQVAALVVRAYEVLTDAPVLPSRRWFDDTSSSVHADAIDVGRDLGILRGTDRRDYAPLLPVRRDQTASLVANLLDAAARETS